MSNLIIHRDSKPSFTVVDNRVIRERTLSYSALGLYVYLCSLPDGWTLRRADLLNRTKNGGEANIGKQALTTAMDELKRSGHLTTSTKQQDDGRLAGRSFDFYENAADNPTSPKGGFPDSRENRKSGKPKVGKTAPIINTNSLSNTDYLTKNDISSTCQEVDAQHTTFFEAWEKAFPNKPTPRRTPAQKAKLNRRLKDANFRANYSDALARGKDSTFLQQGRWFTFDWFVKNDENWLKVLDGNYDNKKPASARKADPAAQTYDVEALGLPVF
jgi:hypothetical protein